MSKAKQQGTAFESWLVKKINAVSYDLWAERIVEGGIHDRGDVRLVDTMDEEWIIECKAKERLNVTRELAKAKKKSGITNTVVAWKRLVPNGGTRRTADGEPVVVVMGLDTYLQLLGAHPDD